MRYASSQTGLAHLCTARLLLHASLLLLGLKPRRVLPGELEGEQVGRDHVVDLGLGHPDGGRLRHEGSQPSRTRLVHTGQVQLHAASAQVGTQTSSFPRPRTRIVRLRHTRCLANGLQRVRLRLLLPHALAKLGCRRRVAGLGLRHFGNVALAAHEAKRSATKWASATAVSVGFFCCLHVKGRWKATATDSPSFCHANPVLSSHVLVLAWRQRHRTRLQRPRSSNTFVSQSPKSLSLESRNSARNRNCFISLVVDALQCESKKDNGTDD